MGKRANLIQPPLCLCVKMLVMEVLVDESRPQCICRFNHNDFARDLKAPYSLGEESFWVNYVMDDIEHQESIDAIIFKGHVRSREYFVNIW